MQKINNYLVNNYLNKKKKLFHPYQTKTFSGKLSLQQIQMRQWKKDVTFVLLDLMTLSKCPRKLDFALDALHLFIYLVQKRPSANVARYSNTYSNKQTLFYLNLVRHNSHFQSSSSIHSSTKLFLTFSSPYSSCIRIQIPNS